MFNLYRKGIEEMKFELHLGLAVTADDAEMDKYPVEKIAFDEFNYEQLIKANPALRDFLIVSNINVYNEELTLLEKGVTPSEWEVRCLGPHECIQYRRKNAQWGDVISELTSMVGGIGADDSNILYVTPDEMYHTPMHEYISNYIKLGSMVVRTAHELPYNIYAGMDAIKFLSTLNSNGYGLSTATTTSFGQLAEKINIFKDMLYDNNKLFIFIKPTEDE